MPDTTDPDFFIFLKNLTTKDVTISAIPEGTVVFAKVPLIRVEGPLAGNKNYIMVLVINVVSCLIAIETNF